MVEAPSTNGNETTFPTSSLDFLASVNLIEIVVAALHQHIRQQLCDQAARRNIVKDDDVINNPQSSKYLSSLGLIEDGPIRPLQLAHGPIAIDRHNERIAERARLRQITHVPDVQKVKHTVCENESLARGAQTLAFRKHRCPGQNLLDH